MTPFELTSFWVAIFLIGLLFFGLSTFAAMVLDAIGRWSRHAYRHTDWFALAPGFIGVGHMVVAVFMIIVTFIRYGLGI